MIFISKSNPYFLFFFRSLDGVLNSSCTPAFPLLSPYSFFPSLFCHRSLLLFKRPSLKQCIYFISLRAFCQVLLKNIFFHLSHCSPLCRYRIYCCFILRRRCLVRRRCRTYHISPHSVNTSSALFYIFFFFSLHFHLFYFPFFP